MPTVPEPNAIHLSCSVELIHAGTEHMLSQGGHAFELSLEDVETRPQLVNAFAETFRIPWPIHGIDAVVSTASDLEWSGGSRAYAVVVTSLDAVPDAVLSDLCGAFPNIIDRMRGAHESYLLMFERSQRTSQVLELLEAENERLRYLERVDPKSDTHPVPIVDHRTDPPTIR